MKGVCFAFEVVENAPNDYSMKLYYPDHSFPGAHFAAGIPLQTNPVYNPTRMAPDMNSFEQYSRRGYAYLHNLMANQVLKQATGDIDANISLMTAPVPGAVNVQDKYKPTGQAMVAGTSYDTEPLGGLGGMGIVQLMAPPGENLNDGTNTRLDDNIRILEPGSYSTPGTGIELVGAKQRSSRGGHAHQSTLLKKHCYLFKPSRWLWFPSGNVR